MSEEGKFNELGMEYYSATPKAGYRFRGNAFFAGCYHVRENTESGSRWLDGAMRDQDWDRQREAIGGAQRRGRG